jgi:hypothetical protein
VRRNQVLGQLWAKFEGSCLNYEEGSKKTHMSADKQGNLAPDNGARKPERLHVIAVAAERVESDSSRINHY